VHGGYEIVRFVKVETTSAEALLRHPKTGNGAKLQVQLDPKDPKKIANVGLQPAKL
jgi:hypothetical protein